MRAKQAAAKEKNAVSKSRQAILGKDIVHKAG